MLGNTLLMIGAFDTKGAEYAYLRDAIVRAGCEVVAMDTSVLGQGGGAFPVEIGAEEVAKRGGSSIAALREGADRGKAMKVMADGVAAIAAELQAEGRIAGAIGMGGTGGTSVVSAGLRALPVGFPKLCLSTAAAGNVAPYVGVKDVVMMPSIVDVAGLNRISTRIISNAAAAIVGMVRAEPPEFTAGRPIIAASMFGNTTACVDLCAKALDGLGYEVLVFHATGTGGRTMEALVDQGMVDAVLDITTTELADTITGGVFDAGPDRLSAPGRAGIPHLIVPGCIDMANFGAADTVPDKYRKAGRLLYEWNPSVTLMRTNVEENRQMGEIFAAKANAARGPLAILIPARGVSILDGDGEQFCDREADAAFTEALRRDLDPAIPVEIIDANINDAAFAERAVEAMMELIKAARVSR